jgi:hypothetical protein
MVLAEDADSLFQIRTTAKHTTLIRNRRAYLAGSRAALEVPIDFPCVELRYFSFRSYLPPQSLPVKHNAALGFCVSSSPFRLSTFVKKQKRCSPTRFASTIRTLGTPSRVEVARAAALGSFGSLS